MSKSIKFQDLVTKVTFHKDTPEDVAVNIMSWVKNAKPVVIQKKRNFNNKEDK
mgnify:FL=1